MLLNFAGAMLMVAGLALGGCDMAVRTAETFVGGIRARLHGLPLS